MSVDDVCELCEQMFEAEWDHVNVDVAKKWRVRDCYWILQQLPSRAHEANHNNEGPEQVKPISPPDKRVYWSTKLVSDKVFKHHGFRDLIRSANDVCRICNVIRNELLLRLVDGNIDVHRLDSDAQSVAVPLLLRGDVHDLGFLVCYFEGVTDDMEIGKVSPLIKIPIYVHQGTIGENPHSMLSRLSHLKLRDMASWRTGATTETIPVLPRTIEAIAKWCRTCFDNHKNCEFQRRNMGLVNTSFTLPTRLLEISSNSRGLSLRVVEAKRMPLKVRYTTLSHCWGEEGCALKLTTQNYRQFKKSIPMESLPQTFSDAADFTHALQLKYLWIDALCIIQDVASDWLKESSRMAWVYSFSYLNLAATKSKNGAGGLFGQNRELISNTVIVKANSKGNFFQGGGWAIIDKSAWNHYVTNSPLNKRAWVLQERLISPRTVHFARDQIWWECQDLQTCEAVPPGYNYSIAGENRAHFNSGSWQGLIEAYSSLALSHQSDKEIAIAGIAKSFELYHFLAAEDYIAGLWRDRMPFNLLWFAQDPSPRTEERLRAPSWSWTCVNEAVRWVRAKDLKVDGAATMGELAPSDSEPPREGSIILNGCLKEIAFAEPHICECNPKPHFTYLARLEPFYGPMVPRNCIVGEASEDDFGDFVAHFDRNPIVSPGNARNLRFLAIADFKTQESGWQLAGLLLEYHKGELEVQSPGGGQKRRRGYYTRVGLMKLRFRDHDQYDGWTFGSQTVELI